VIKAVFVIELASRRVGILGSTPHPNGLFMRQVVRIATAADAGPIAAGVWICDRGRKSSRDVRRLLDDAGIRVVLIPERAPNANAYAGGSCDRSRKSASIGCFRSANVTSGGRSRSLSSIIIANGITRGSTIGSLRAHR
jgi:hypothetical protein